MGGGAVNNSYRVPWPNECLVNFILCLMKKDQEISLLGEASQRYRQAVPPLMLALPVVHDTLQGSIGVQGGTQAVLVASRILMTSKLVQAHLQLLSLRETQVHVRDPLLITSGYWNVCPHDLIHLRI